MTIDEWPDMQALFSEHGDQNGCWCMYWRVKRADFHRSYGEPLRLAMERVIRQGSVPGILAYLVDGAVTSALWDGSPSRRVRNSPSSTGRAP